jgi:hypothetical protein
MPQKNTRKLEYAFRTNALDYMFIVNPDTKKQSAKDGRWLAPGVYEVYFGAPEALVKYEGKAEEYHRGLDLDNTFNKNPVRIEFPQEAVMLPRASDAKAIWDNQFRICSTFGSRSGYHALTVLNRLDPTELPRDLFEIIAVPAPAPAVFALKK